MTAHGVLTYLNNLKDYCSLLTDVKEVLNSKVADITTMIGNIKTTPTLDDGRAIINVINTLGFSDEDGQCLIKATNDRVKVGAPISMQKRAQQHVRGGDNCLGWVNYLTQSDWDTVYGRSAQAAMECVGWRSSQAGMHCGSEKLYGIMSAALFVANAKNEKPTSTMLKNKKEDVANSTKKLEASNRFPFEHVAMYPESPLELPEQVRRHIYGDDLPVPPPEGLTDAVLKLMKGVKFLRKGGKGDDTERFQIQAQSPPRLPPMMPADGMSAGFPSSPWQIWQMMMSFQQQSLLHTQQSQHNVASSSAFGSNDQHPACSMQALGSWRPRTSKMIGDGRAASSGAQSSAETAADDGAGGDAEAKDDTDDDANDAPDVIKKPAMSPLAELQANLAANVAACAGGVAKRNTKQFKSKHAALKDHLKAPTFARSCADPPPHTQTHTQPHSQTQTTHNTHRTPHKKTPHTIQLYHTRHTNHTHTTHKPQLTYHITLTHNTITHITPLRTHTNHINNRIWSCSP